MDITDNRFDPVPGPGILRLINDAGILRILDSNGKRYRTRPEPGTPVHAVAATATLTITAAIADDTVTIGDTTYTFAVSTSGANTVAIGGDNAGSIVNLVSAINEGAGAEVGTGTVIHPLVTAVDNEDGTVTITAKTPGVSGNTITSVASLDDGSFDSATLTSGVNATPAQAGDQLYDDDFLYTAATDVGLTSTTGWLKSAGATL